MLPQRRGSVRYNGVEELLRIAGGLDRLPGAEYPIEHAAHSAQNRLPNGFPPAPNYAEYSANYGGSDGGIPQNAVSLLVSRHIVAQVYPLYAVFAHCSLRLAMFPARGGGVDHICG